MNHELRPFPSRSSDLGPLIENARNYISNARSEATRRQYAASWNDFQRWNAAHGLRALPADPATVALFIADRSNLAGRLAAINYMQSCTEFDLHNGIADKTGIVAVILRIEQDTFQERRITHPDRPARPITCLHQSENSSHGRNGAGASVPPACGSAEPGGTCRRWVAAATGSPRSDKHLYRGYPNFAAKFLRACGDSAFMTTSLPSDQPYAARSLCGLLRRRCRGHQ